jgi:parvulin-like peptidyl-prolyl isomerase
MIAMERGREARQLSLLLSLFVIVPAYTAWAQQDPAAAYPVAPPAPGGDAPAAKASRRSVRLTDLPDVPPVKPAAIPVNPGDAIAIVNGQPITRQQLADECVARKGKEILDLLINRSLIQQALRSRNLEVTGAEVDQEIDQIATRFGIGREKWLLTLEKERGITPAQYAKDLIYPAIAMRKLCAGRVQVTPKDMQDAFEAQYGDKINCRMIMVDKQIAGMEIWEELKKNPGAFEKLAQDRSVDPGTRALGGLLAQPITRHAYPQHLSDAAFRSLVDGDPRDRDPSHKPKDGDFTGLIQVSESSWVILRRESVVPGKTGIDPKNEQVRKQLYDMVYEVKLKEAMGAVFQEFLNAAAIENKLTGSIKLAHEQRNPDYRVDGSVNLMSNPPAAKQSGSAPNSEAAPAADATARPKLPPPVALSPEAAKQFDAIQQRGSKSGSQN